VFLDPCIYVRLRRHILRNLAYYRHYRARRSLMHHVAGARNAVKFTLSNVSMKSARLFIRVNHSVFLARDDTDRHPQARILILEVYGARNHESGFRG
jgi:hypothetical protein